ncbi:response regulator [Pseudanabaena sp. FACHB-2040]|uniref:response regulator n=1 Tax=Pseudanabaena sp. FACHB-2040 TaxID=2692859 RepID=UPI001687E1A7|nr:response regulator [Pseudanabaena sp. FACHB-2040]MBD2260406.1 response regulator [Pseudanabaena sp. FACHB-2040]
MRILLIEDDEILAERLTESLASQNYVVDAVADGQLGLEYAQGTDYDLILTDVGLPHLDGITLCQRLRAAGCSTPILLMTARDAPDERVRGLDAGADDHLIKPLNLDELHARLRALLRRGEVAATAVLSLGPLRLNPVSCQVTYADQLLKLTPKEYNLLELFLRNPARVFSRGQIIEHLWNFDDPPLEDSVKAHVKGLRRKLKQADSLEWIENVYGLGYRLNPDVLNLDEAQAAVDQAAHAAALPAPMGPLEQDFRQAMGGLWQQYQGLMAERLGSLQAAAQAIQAGTLSEALRQSGMQAAHKLAGVLGMFECDEGTAIARQLETLLESSPAPAAQTVVDLVQQLAAQMALSAQPAAAPSEPVALLLVTLDPELSAELQALAAAAELSWVEATTLAEAQALVQQRKPERVVLEIASASQWTESLTFLHSLTTQTPPVSALALTTLDSLVDRVAIARALTGQLGQTSSQRLLVKPVTATQVWSQLIPGWRLSPLTRAQVLVVDDDPLIPAALRPLLEPWGLGVVGLASPQQFWDVLNRVAPDLLILDVEMPQFSGIDLCQAVRVDPHWQNLPILFLTAHQDRDTVQQVFTAGADDFITKPIVGPELLTRILNRLERNQLLQTVSRRDPLTGLLNYTQSRQALTDLLQQTNAGSLALLKLVDLGNLQTRCGPETVYQILQHWGSQIQSGLRNSDIAGYWGNGEIIVGMAGLNQPEATDMLAPLCQRLRQHIVTLPTGERLQPELAIALTSYPENSTDLFTLYQSLVKSITP